MRNPTVLCGFRQVTRPGVPSRDIEDKRGLRQLHEAVYRYQLHGNQNQLADELSQLVGRGLQQDEDDRPTMDGVANSLWHAWKTSLVQTSHVQAGHNLSPAEAEANAGTELNVLEYSMGDAVALEGLELHDHESQSDSKTDLHAPQTNSTYITDI